MISLPSCGGQGLSLSLLSATSWPLLYPIKSTGTWSVSNTLQALNYFPKVSFFTRACNYAFAHLFVCLFVFSFWWEVLLQSALSRADHITGRIMTPRTKRWPLSECWQGKSCGWNLHLQSGQPHICMYVGSLTVWRLQGRKNDGDPIG